MATATTLLLLIGPVASAAVFLFSRRRRVPVAFGVAAGLDALCGTENLMLGGAHLVAVLARALSGKGTGGSPVFAYDFRLYSLVLLGVVILLPALLCLAAVGGLMRGEVPAWRRAFWSSTALLAVNLPLMPIQGFAYGLAAAALASLVGLAAVRKRLRRGG